MKLDHKYTLLVIYVFMLVTFSNASQINAEGASFPKHVYEEWIEAYAKETGIQISYDPTGSGAGIISAVRRESDFSGTDKPLRSWRLRRYKLKMFPTVVGSIVLAYNLPGISDNELKLSEKAIAAIFSGRAKYWDDPLIVKDNPLTQLPHALIKVAVREDESGTTYNFTYYLRKIDYPHFRKASKAFNWQAKTIIRARGSSGMSRQIQENPYSIGYVDYSSKQKHHLTAATIQNRAGKWVVPTLQSCAKGAQHANMKKEKDFYNIVAYQEGKMSYPLIATSFILLPDEPSSKNREIIRFFDWAFSEGGYIANKNGFSMLPEKTIHEIRSYWREFLYPQEEMPALSVR